MNATTFSVIAALLLITGAWLFSSGPSAAPGESARPEGPSENVVMEGGTQVITIGAKGGYLPRVSYARAGVPSEIRLETSNTYDCSAAVVIPSLDYREFLPPNGAKEVPVPPQKAGTTLRGLCTMGMYNFAIQFK